MSRSEAEGHGLCLGVRGTLENVQPSEGGLMATPLPTIAGVYYGYVWMTYLGNRCGSIFAWLDAVPETDPANDAIKAQHVADALVSSWNANMLPRYPTAVHGTDSRVYALGHPLVPPAFSNSPATGAGGSTVAGVAQAAVIRHNVFRRGRGSQSHTAISPLQDSEVSNDGTSVTSAFVTNLNSDFGNFIGGVQAAFTAATSGDTISYVQVSKRLHRTFDITSSSTETLLGTERSRTSRP
jgi:hypothetical protein